MTVNPVTSNDSDREIRVIYRGQPMEEGTMSALDLGLSMAGLSELVSQSARVVYGDGLSVRTQVKSEFSEGSFEVDFVIQSIAAISVSIPDLMALLFGDMGLIEFLRLTRGGRCEKVGDSSDGDSVIVKVDGNDNNVTLNRYVFNLQGDQKVRKSTQTFMGPLEQEGMESMDLSLPPEVGYVSIPHEEVRSFRAPTARGEAVRVDWMRLRNLMVVSPNFTPGSKWRLRWGDIVFFAAIRDEGFLERVANHEVTFGDGDVLDAEVSIEVTLEDGKEKYSHAVEKVHDHQPPSRYRQTDFIQDG